MDDNLMKQILENNSKLNSMAKAILVRWKWDDNKHYRIFLGLRHGGTRETQFDLDQNILFILMRKLPCFYMQTNLPH